MPDFLQLGAVGSPKTIFSTSFLEFFDTTRDGQSIYFMPCCFSGGFLAFLSFDIFIYENCLLRQPVHLYTLWCILHRVATSDVKTQDSLMIIGGEKTKNDLPQFVHVSFSAADCFVYCLNFPKKSPLSLLSELRAPTTTTTTTTSAHEKHKNHQKHQNLSC